MAKFETFQEQNYLRLELLGQAAFRSRQNTQRLRSLHYSFWQYKGRDHDTQRLVETKSSAMITVSPLMVCAAVIATGVSVMSIVLPMASVTVVFPARSAF